MRKMPLFGEQDRLLLRNEGERESFFVCLFKSVKRQQVLLLSALQPVTAHSFRVARGDASVRHERMSNLQLICYIY